MGKSLLILVLFAVLFGVAVVKFELIDVKQLAVDTLGLKLAAKSEDPDNGVNGETSVGNVVEIHRPGAGIILPVRRTLVDVKGRSLEVTVLGKRGDSIAVRRSTDGKEFVVPLENLSSGDRQYFQKSSDQKVSVFSQIERRAAMQGRVARWHPNITGAKKEALEFDIPILLLFTGSSWCPPCQALEKEVLRLNSFREFANENVALAKIVVPANQKLGGFDEALRERYQVNSYPTMLLLTPAGEKIYEKKGFSKDPRAYIDKLSRAVASR